MEPTAASLLRDARTKAGLTQTQLAKHAGVTQSVISAYESGRREPSFATLKRLVEATGNSLDVALQPARPSGQLQRRLEENRDELVLRLEELGARNIRVFGSVARGEAGPDSDIDLLIDLDEGVGLFALSKMKGEAERLLGAPVDLVHAAGLKARLASTALHDAIAL
jgi:uncharacterized protein